MWDFQPKCIRNNIGNYSIAVCGGFILRCHFMKIVANCIKFSHSPSFTKYFIQVYAILWARFFYFNFIFMLFFFLFLLWSTYFLFTFNMENSMNFLFNKNCFFLPLFYLKGIYRKEREKKPSHKSWITKCCRSFQYEAATRFSIKLISHLNWTAQSLQRHTVALCGKGCFW